MHMKLHEITAMGDEMYDPEARAWVARASARGRLLDQLMQLHRFHRLRRARNHAGGAAPARGHKRAGAGGGNRDAKR